MNKVKQQEGLLKKNKNLFLEAHFQSGFADMEKAKITLNNSNDEDFLQHLEVLNKKGVNRCYVKCFNFCKENKYKEEEISAMEQEFKNTLFGLNPPEEPQKIREPNAPGC